MQGESISPIAVDTGPSWKNKVVAVARVKNTSYCDHAGWASKQGHVLPTWKRRYFVLKNRELLYYVGRSPSGKGIEEKGRVKVSGVEFTPSYKNALAISGELKNQGFTMQLDSYDECTEWYRLLQSALEKHRAQLSELEKAKTAAYGQVEMRGWLYKEGQNFKTWKRRFMTLRGDLLQYHASESDAPLGETRVNDCNRNPHRPFGLDVYSDNNRILRLSADTFDEIKAWDAAISRAINKPPCFGLGDNDDKKPFLQATFADVADCEGWLYKQGKHARAWKKRYFYLQDACLQYREGPAEDAKGGGIVTGVSLSKEDAECMDIRLDSGRVICVNAETKEDFSRWVQALAEVLGQDRETLRLRSSEGQRLSRGSNSSDKSVSKAGWLEKEGKNVKSWKRRYFVLEGRTLSYYEQVEASPLAVVTVATVRLNGELEVELKTGRVLRLRAQGYEDMVAWYEALLKSVDEYSPSKVASLASLASTAGSSGSMMSGNGMEDPGRGFLFKRGQNVKSWKRRFFVLEGKKMSYSQDIGTTVLGQGVVTDVKLGFQRPFSLDVTMVGGRVLSIATAGQSEMAMWHRCLLHAVEQNGETAVLGSEEEQDVPVISSSSEEEEASLSGGRSLSLSLNDMSVVPTCSGYLRKQGGTFKTWKSRFFTLHGTTLCYFENDHGPLLNKLSVCHVVSDRHRRLCMEVTASNGRRLLMAAESKAEFDKWLQALHQAATGV